MKAPEHIKQQRQGRRYEGKGRSNLHTIPNPPPTLLGARLRELREDAGMRQGDLAPLLNTYANRISDWELGMVVPSLPILVRYAKVFGTSVSAILAGVM